MNNKNLNNITEMQNLIDKLNKYSYEYYTLGEPTISDQSYDLLYDKLLKLEEETNTTLSNSPTQRVGYETLKGLAEVIHEFPLLSLNKCHSEQEVIEWSNNKNIIAMLKMDGLTTDLTYDNGKLIKAETRGNGEIGEDILHNVTHYYNIPLKIKDKRHIHIIGESIIDYEEFNRINELLTKDDKYKNPRNLVSGTVRQLDSSICQRRKVTFVGYNLIGIDELKSKTQHLDYIEELGFTPCPCSNTLFSLSVNNIADTIEGLSDIAKLMNYPIDGIVFEYNDIKYGLSLGNTTHHPRHSIAYKFKQDLQETKLIEVKYQVGRTGKITPVAVFEPVEIDGTTITQASVHNLSMLQDLQLHKGDRITVFKANQIIPQIKDNLDKDIEHTTIPYLTLNKCPICGETTEIITSDNSSAEYCVNDSCKARLIQKLSHYCSRNAMDIEGLSDKTLEKFIDLGLLKSISDIYYLQKDKARELILQQDGFGIKSYNNLINSIEKSKNCKLENFIFALGVPNVGLSTAKNMVKYCEGNSSIETLNNIISLPIHKWLDMKDCGETVAASIYNYFNNQDNLKRIGYISQELKFVNPINNIKTEIQDNILKGKTIYCTGKFTLKKDELKDKIYQLGGIYANGYKKSLDYLIAGGDTTKSGKVDKAKKDNVPILTEDKLMSLFANCFIY